MTELLPEDDKGVGMLALNESYAQLITMRKGLLYLTRRIDTARPSSRTPASATTAKSMQARWRWPLQR